MEDLSTFCMKQLVWAIYFPVEHINSYLLDSWYFVIPYHSWCLHINLIERFICYQEKGQYFKRMYSVVEDIGTWLQ